jgi:probable rRNA maturation factor
MLEVVLDRTNDWNDRTNWVEITEKAVAAAFSVSSHGYLAKAPFALSISIKLSDDSEVHELNRLWRGKDAPTNVLSFPMLDADDLDALSNTDDGEVLFGDMILAYGICKAEAAEKHIPLPQHISHLVVHGTLHLLGLDHIDEAQAEHMEALEVKALASMGIDNPYIEN